MTTDLWAEEIARIIDPSSWRVFDSYREEAARKHDKDMDRPGRWEDKASLAKAREILALWGEPIRAFMCKIAWDLELGHDAGGTRLYPSLNALQDQHPMAFVECGVVEVEVRYISTPVPEDHALMVANAKPAAAVPQQQREDRAIEEGIVLVAARTHYDYHYGAGAYAKLTERTQRRLAYRMIATLKAIGVLP